MNQIVTDVTHSELYLQNLTEDSVFVCSVIRLGGNANLRCVNTDNIPNWSFVMSWANRLKYFYHLVITMTTFATFATTVDLFR